VKVLVVGSGGREHALAWKLRRSPRVNRLYCAPGNAGTASLGENIGLRADDVRGLLSFAQTEGIDLTVVGPEAPLVAGIVDQFRARGLLIAGPTRAAARLEGSKVFAKRFLHTHGIPTAAFEVFDNPDDAEQRLRKGAFSFPVVVKADGLAAGKGVIICRDLGEALAAVLIIMRERRFGEAGDRLLVERFLSGEEASFMVFSDGERVVPMVASQDHKAIFEGDQGPNTGGMGAFSTDSLLSDELRGRIQREIIEPTVRGMASDGEPFQGILYAGLMLTGDGPKVLEYNVRLGDPEAQVVLPRLEGDLLDLLLATAEGNLTGVAARWRPDAAVCVVVASGGYPGRHATGFEIAGLTEAEKDREVVVFHGGTEVRDGAVVTAGGRVLGVTALGETLQAAVAGAYAAVTRIRFEGMYYRRDIGSKGLPGTRGRRNSEDGGRHRR
jgi:phosphoribosylamine---glycine ligase